MVAVSGKVANGEGFNDPRDIAAYVTDSGGWTVGAEVAQGPVKLGRSSGRWAPFALLAAAAMWGDVCNPLDVWWQRHVLFQAPVRRLSTATSLGDRMPRRADPDRLRAAQIEGRLMALRDEMRRSYGDGREAAARAAAWPELWGRLDHALAMLESVPPP